MQALLREVRTAALLTIVLAVIICGVYPMLIYALAQGFFPPQANGSIIYYNGTAVGSSLLGQPFSGSQYFQPRPSASGYDGTASGGTNLGPTSRQLADTVNERVQRYRTINNVPAETPVPADAATASASGLDPHISVENAMLQAPRVAAARGWSTDDVVAIVRQHAVGRTLGVMGEPRVNVLQLNLALDEKQKAEK